MSKSLTVIASKLETLLVESDALNKQLDEIEKQKRLLKYELDVEMQKANIPSFINNQFKFTKTKNYTKRTLDPKKVRFAIVDDDVYNECFNEKEYDGALKITKMSANSLANARNKIQDIISMDLDGIEDMVNSDIECRKI